MTDTLERARTPLLTLLTQEAVDSDYQAAASRRRAAGEKQVRQRGAVLLVVGLFATLVTVAALQTSRNADVDDLSRSTLIERIHDRRESGTRLQADAQELRESNAAADDALRRLGGRYADVAAHRTELAVLTGFEAVTGDGVRITLDNAPYAGDNERIRDADLTLLVNALWEAGAEAISINGQRLTAMTAIRNSGVPIEVNHVGIAPPYTILAIGDGSSLAANVVETASGLQFLAVAGQYGFTHEVDNVSRLRLPAAPASQGELRSATRKPNPKGGVQP